MNTHTADIHDHLIFNPAAFYINTPMIDELRTVISQWQWSGHTGGYIVGRSRVGKTRAIEAATASLTTRSGKPVPAFYMNFRARDRATITAVFRNLKSALRVKLRSREISDVMSDEILHCLADAALSNPSRYVVLVVDEVQRATIEQLLAFNELYDELVKLRINLFVVFVANIGESNVLLKQVQERKYEQIRGRFFMKGYQYHGIRNLRDLEGCLRAYDEKPNDTDEASITETFLPTAYHEGWRLQHLAPTIWQIYREEFQQALNCESWGMQYFLATIRTLLADYLPQYGTDNAAEVEEMIRKSIQASESESAIVTCDTAD